MARIGKKTAPALLAVFVAMKDSPEWKQSRKYWHFSIQKNNLGTSTEASFLILQEGCAYPQNNVELLLPNTCLSNFQELPSLFSSC